MDQRVDADREDVRLEAVTILRRIAGSKLELRMDGHEARRRKAIEAAAAKLERSVKQAAKP
jgi:hypothetical protein